MPLTPDTVRAQFVSRSLIVALQGAQAPEKSQSIIAENTL